MYEKALIAIIFMYCVSGGILIAQYIAGDLMGITLQNYKGEEIKIPLTESYNVATLNSSTQNIINANYTLVDVAAAFVAAGSVVTQLLILLTGFYIYQVLVTLGVPLYVVLILVVPYAFLLARALIAYIRGL